MRVVQQQAFGQLQFEAIGARAGTLEHCEHLGDKVALQHLPATDVDRDAQVGVGGLFGPHGQLLASFVQHPLAQRQDQARFFGQWNEFARRNQPALRMLPAHQRLSADGLALRVHLHLIEQQQLVFLQRGAQVLLQRHAVEHGGVHFGVKKAHDVAPGLFGLVHGKVSVLHQVISAGGVVGEQHHPNAARALHCLARQMHRLGQ